jgi:hypothetical protein
MSRPWSWALRLTAVATVVPLWLVRFLPFSDMPEQIAVIATLRHWWDGGWRLQEHYTLAFGKSQYLLYHVVGALLSTVTGSAELANRLLLTAVGVAYPYALRALLRSLGRDERLALFGAPAFWSRPLLMGFLPYVASVPAVVWALALSVKDQDRPTRRRAVALAGVALAIFYLHADAYVLLAMTAVALSFARAPGDEGSWTGRARAAARTVSWLAPSAVVASLWTAFGSIANRAKSLTEPGQIDYIPARDLVREFPSWAHDVWRSHVDEASSVLLWGAFVVLLLLQGRARSPEERRRDGVAFVPFACAVAVYFAVPYHVGAGVMLNLRLAVFVVLFAPMVLRPRAGWRGAVPLGAVLAVSLLTSATAAAEVRRTERDELGQIERLVDRIPLGARVLTLTFHVTSAHVQWAPWTFMGAYHRARAGGVASVSFSELSHWPIHYRPESAPPWKPQMFWTFDSCLYANAVDGPYYDYVLARGNVNPFRDAPPGPRWREVDRERDWVLYEKLGGAPNPPWSVDDRGPCESRWSLEQARLGKRFAPGR